MISLLILPHLFKVSTLRPHTITKTAMPLVNCIVNGGLVDAKSAPNAAWVRQHCAPVTDTLAAGRRSISCSELDWGLDCLAATNLVEWKQVLLAREVAQCHVPGVQERCHVERRRTRLTRQHHWQQLLWHEHVMVVGAVYLCSWINEDRSVTPRFDTSTETMTDWLNVVCVRSRRSAATCFFFTT